MQLLHASHRYPRLQGTAPRRPHAHAQPLTAPTNAHSLLQEMMRGMAQEPAQGCSYSACGAAACQNGLVAAGQAACLAPAAGTRLRCCPPEPYSDVFIWADRGISNCVVDRRLMAGYDTSLLTSSWSNVRELVVLPGAGGQLSGLFELGFACRRCRVHAGACGHIQAHAAARQARYVVCMCARAHAAMHEPPKHAHTPHNHPGGKLQQRTSYQELDMASPDTLRDFLRAALAAYPPSDDRKYVLSLWDHGSGWAGYGIDSTCSPLKAYNDRGCNMLTMATIAKGVCVQVLVACMPRACMSCACMLCACSMRHACQQVHAHAARICLHASMHASMHASKMHLGNAAPPCREHAAPARMLSVQACSRIPAVTPTLNRPGCWAARRAEAGYYWL